MILSQHGKMKMKNRSFIETLYKNFCKDLEILEPEDQTKYLKELGYSDERIKEAVDGMQKLRKEKHE